jgi:hypothetical protein
MVAPGEGKGQCIAEGEWRLLGNEKEARNAMEPGPEIDWLRGLDLNQRPLGYEPNELPDCSTPHLDSNNRRAQGQTTPVPPRRVP